MIKPLDDVLHDFSQIFEVEQQSGLVQLCPRQGDTDLVIMAVRVLALALVVAQVVPCGKRIVHGDFEHDPPAAGPTRPSVAYRQTLILQLGRQSSQAPMPKKPSTARRSVVRL